MKLATLFTVLPVTAASLLPRNETIPIKNVGILLLSGFEPLDVFNPLDVLQITAFHHQLNLLLLARSLSPVTTAPSLPSMNPYNSSFYPSLTPTHTFAETLTQPESIDVLIVPGGPGVRNPDLDPEIAFVRAIYPHLKYLITICTGSSVAARAGVLDGKRATTNKKAWGQVTPLGPKVKWVAPARWVVDGNVWSSSGVTAGLDLIYAFVKEVFPDGDMLVEHIGGLTEYEPQTNSSYDPWAETWEVPTQNVL
ncbi:hypothetical protein OQA88_12169 [Cercophora sp. LCS_1]